MRRNFAVQKASKLTSPAATAMMCSLAKHPQQKFASSALTSEK